MRHLHSRTLVAALIAATLAAPVPAQSRAPELPRSVPSVAMPATTRVVSVGADLQGALNAARGGDALELPCGATYTGAFIIPARRDSGWVVLRPSCHAQLPPEGTRIDTATARRLKLPRLVSADAGYAIATALGAHHTRIVGLEITTGTTFGTQSYGLVGLGTHQGQAAPGTLAHDLVLDRVYVHGTPTMSLRRCVALNSGSAAIVDSWISECHDIGSDAQAIGGWNGPGPFLIRNNRLEGSTENVMFGGSDAEAEHLSPGDITVQRNYIVKPRAWQQSYWQIKNLFELKDAKRVLVEGNLFEGSWPQAWDGTAIAMKSMNQDCRAPWAGTTDVTFRRNLIRKTGSGINLAATQGCQPTVTMARVAFTHNLMLGIKSKEYPGQGNGFFTGGALTDVTLDHNTFTWVGWGVAMNIDDFDHPTSRFTLTNNVFATVGGVGLQGQSVGWPGASVAHFMPGGRVTGNVFAVGTEFSCCQNPSRNWDTYPPGNRMVLNDDTLFARIGFVNGAAGDVRLAPASPLKGLASDGTDPGADVPAVLAAVAGVVEGTPADVTHTPPAPAPIPAPVISLAELRAAITALDKVVGPNGREALATKRALTPVQAYLKALEQAIP